MKKTRKPKLVVSEIRPRNWIVTEGTPRKITGIPQSGYEVECLRDKLLRTIPYLEIVSSDYPMQMGTGESVRDLISEIKTCAKGGLVPEPVSVPSSG